MKFAFKCRTCGHLDEAGNAGEREVPAACRACGAGVSFDPKSGAKTYDEDNWIVLDDLKGDELDKVLKFHAIERGDIERHVPFDPAKVTRAPQSIERSAEERVGMEDHPS